MDVHAPAASTYHTRSMSDVERKRALKWSSGRKGPDFVRPILGAVVFSLVVACFVFLVIFAVPFLILDEYSPGDTRGFAKDFFYPCVGVFLIVSLLTLWRSVSVEIHNARALAPSYRRAYDDIRTGVVEAARFRMTEALMVPDDCDCEPPNYWCRLEDGRSILITDYGGDFSDDPDQPFPASELEVVRLPETKLVVGLRSFGTPLDSPSLKPADLSDRDFFEPWVTPWEQVVELASRCSTEGNKAEAEA